MAINQRCRGRSRADSPARQVIGGLLESFPKAATQTLAKRAYREAPELWPTFNACHLMIRRLRGQQGSKMRANTADRAHFRDRRSTESFPKLPEGITHLEDWQAEQIDTVGTWLVMSDVHAPYHDAGVIRALWREARRRKIVGVLLNGDIADCFAVSRWEKDPRKRDFAAELKVLRAFFESLFEAFPRAELVWKHGNHEERWDAYMQLKAPELLDVAEFDFGEITHANDLGLRTVKDKHPIKLGKLFVLHGHEYRFAIQNPVNPARGLFLRSQVNALCGHFHQSSHHSEKNLAEHVTSCWSTGCLCDLHPGYMPINKHNHGAAFVTLSRDGAFEVNNFRVIDGKLWM